MLFRSDFGPSSINVIAIETQQPSEKNLNGRWFEAISPGKIIPQDIHAAQLARRLEQSKQRPAGSAFPDVR